MQIFQQILFVLISGIAIWLFAKKVKEIRRNINLGRDEDFSDNKSLRWKNLFLLAFGQKKMFRNPLVAVLHFVIYAGFIIINIEVLEIILDGLLGTHRVFLQPLAGFYTVVINFFEILAIGVIAVCLVFLARRNITRVRRLISRELNGWPKTDANYILIAEIILMSLFLTMNAADRVLQLQGNPHYPETGDFIISGMLASLFNNFSVAQLVVLER